jgi:hypothetical protein
LVSACAGQRSAMNGTAFIIDMKDTKDGGAMTQNKNYYVAVSDITFYLYDEDGNAKTDKSGNEITYRLKDGMRFKPLEYIADGLEPDMLQPIK